MFFGGVTVLVLYVFAMGSAHRLNSAHSRLGVYTIDDRRVGFRYLICPGETVKYVELTIAHNTEAQRVWILNDPDSVEVEAGMPIPVDLEAGRDYTIEVQVGDRLAGQGFKPGRPPPFGQLLVRGQVRDSAQFEETAVASCARP